MCKHEYAAHLLLHAYAIHANRLRIGMLDAFDDFQLSKAAAFYMLAFLLHVYLACERNARRE